jgi:hypothetical protein
MITKTMKNFNLIKIIASLILVVLFSTSKTNAFIDFEKGMFVNYINTNQGSIPEMSFEIQDVMNEAMIINEVEIIAIEIFDQNLNIIAFGSESDDRIHDFIQKSDLISEVKGKKYFRLSYDIE